jgi:hypothetical protein
MKCWASELGDCNDIQSGEHLVSGAVFTGPAVKVVGSLWPGVEEKTIGLKSLKSNVLCDSHNSRLSPLDTEAGRAFRSFAEYYQVLAGRLKIRPRPWPVFNWGMEGSLLERWFIKTSTNILAAHCSKAWWSDPTNRITLPLLAAIFEGAPLPFPAGLYARLESGTFTSDDSVAFRSVVSRAEGERRQVGGFFSFRGAQFLIWLDSRRPPSSHPDCAEIESLVHRPPVLGGVVGGHLSQTITFKW